MLVNTLLSTTDPIIASTDTILLRDNCSTFLKESAGFPLYKTLPRSYQNFQKVKVRQRKQHDIVAEAFNQAFQQEVANLRQRAIFTSCNEQEDTEDTENFFVFPINGYKYMYCKEVENSSLEYQQVLTTLFEAYSSNDSEVYEIVCDLLKRTYIKENLIEGLMSKSEIIFYNVPYYYVVRCSHVPKYGTFYNHLIKHK